MRRTLMIVALATVVVAVGGVAAVAAPGGGLLGGDPDERRADDARALADKLGIDESRVSRALQDVARERRDAHRAERAAALAKELGVSPEQVEAAMREARDAQRGEDPPNPCERQDAFLEAFAKALAKSADEVRAAQASIARAKRDEHLDQAVEDGFLTESQAEQMREHAQRDGGPRLTCRDDGEPKLRRHRLDGPGGGPLGDGLDGGPPLGGMVEPGLDGPAPEIGSA